MALELDDVTSGYNLSTINSNFQKTEDYVNDKLLHRANTGVAGEAKMERDLDMNGHAILNIKTNPDDEGSVIDIATFKSAVRVPEGEQIAPIGNAAERSNKALVFDLAGQPITIPLSPAPSDIYAALGSSTGQTLVGDPVDSNLQVSLLARTYNVTSVNSLAGKNFKAGMKVRTFQNSKGLPVVDDWDISATQNTSTYSIALSNGLYANLIVKPDMSFASFGFGGTDVENVAAVDEGNRVARANAVMRSLSFPAGTFFIGAFTLDVDRRAFIWDGAGWDGTYLISTTSGTSMHHVLIDPRNRAKDRDHFYQQVKGFTIDGNIDNNGANAANRVLCSAHYSTLEFKSVGHRLSNVDICGLVIHWKGLTGGRTNGATTTLNSVRVRYNSIKIDGYIGGSSSSQVALLIHGPSTTFATAGAIGDTSINVTSAVGFSVGDILEISGGTLEAKIITNISGNTITFDSPLVATHTVGGTVRLPVFGTAVTGTIEVGQVQIGNCSGTSIRGMYTEESRFYIFGFADGLEIHGNTIGESTPTITVDSTVDRNSTIRIVCNQTAFPVTVNVADRSGSVNGILDLNRFPELDISQSTRAQNSILVNGIYAFKSLKVERYYDSAINDRAMTSFKFTGFSATAAALSTTEILRFAQNISPTGYDGHSLNLECTLRRTNGLSGYLVRAGQSSQIGGSISDTITRTVSNYTYFDATNGADIFFGSNTGRVGIVFKGEPAGGQTVKAMINGEVISVL